MNLHHRNTHRRSSSTLLAGLLLVLISAEISAQPPGGQLLEETITLGTRVDAGRSSLASPVPADRINADDMRRTGGTETARILQRLAPSFNFPSSTISDGTDSVRPATLRGLGPDQVLVLVNGKRRHTSALIHVNGSVGRGTAGVDLNAIPASAIARIEVLRDGAAAQYGSDAIAGVINIVLRDNPEGGEVGFSYGEYEQGDGNTRNGWWHRGWQLGDGGFLTSALEYRERGPTSRARPDGSQWFPCVTPATDDADCGTFDAREFTVERDVFRVGDADSQQLALVLNAGIPLLGGGEIYGFLSFSERDNISGGFYRRPVDENRNPPIGADGEAWAPLGFLPLINTDIEDLSFGAGWRSSFRAWDTDLSLFYGANDFEFRITDSVNASHANVYGAASPTRADAGTLGIDLLTLNLDVSRALAWGHLAWGAEWRRDGYEIHAGDELSWQDYDNGCRTDPPTAVCLSEVNAAAGIQVFPGFRPQNEVDEERRALSLYGDVEYTGISNLLLTAAARYERYSDFGDTVTGKLAGRWQLHSTLALRAALSSGFRAPSMQQLYFNNVSTQFVAVMGTDVPMEVGTFRNNDAVTRAIGIPELEEETSFNYGLGFIYTPVDTLHITLDLYRIDIDDRIIISAQLEQAPNDDGTCSNALCTALQEQGTRSGQFFLNAADTQTTGGDLVAAWEPALPGYSELELSLAFNYTNTRIENILVPDVLDRSGISGNELFTRRDQSILEDWQPQDRVNFTAHWERGPVNATLSVDRYGEYTVDDSTEQTFGAKYLTNLQAGYSFAQGWHVEAGGNNIFDETPDENNLGCGGPPAHGRSRASPCGGLTDSAGNTAANYPGVFIYSRRSAPFGFNGAFYYLRLRYTF